jgi:hypothetical protein
MIEESIEAFMVRYKPYAASVELLPRTEGSPLLECYVGRQILRVLERTNPYLARPGKAQLIINPTTERLLVSSDAQKRLKTLSLGTLHITGLILERERHSAIIDAGIPLVVATLEEIADELSVGDWVSFETLAPIHGFVVTKEERQTPKGREVDNDI